MALDFRIEDALPVLERTPRVLDAWLRDLPDAWLHAREAPETWSPFDITGHLIHGERTDWMVRARIILEHGDTRSFEPFDRVAMFEASRGKSIGDLLDAFASLRTENLARLRGLQLADADLVRRGRHPELGGVTLGQLLATWVAHDLSHLAQIARVMGREYADAVGPWRAYLPMLQQP